MFTGIVETLGEIIAIEKRNQFYVLNIRAPQLLGDLKLGDSVSTNGVCLTVTSLTSVGFTADVMGQTLRVTGLGDLVLGSKVNLERAMAANGRFGGHMVSGHIDGVGKIRKIEQETEAIWLTVSVERGLMKYIVDKGSIAIDGVSLTVAEVGADYFKVSLIPHTAKETTLGFKRSGNAVNLECDVIGKYIEKLLKEREGGQSCLNLATLEAFLRD